MELLKVNLEIDQGLAKPYYIQIADQITALIMRGELKPAQRLPAVRELGEQIGVNFNTAARAYRHLDRMGWIRTRQGRGTYVVDRMERETVRGMRQEVFERLVEDFTGTAGQMGFSEEEIMGAVANQLNVSRET